MSVNVNEKETAADAPPVDDVDYKVKYHKLQGRLKAYFGPRGLDGWREREKEFEAEVARRGAAGQDASSVFVNIGRLIDMHEVLHRKVNDNHQVLERIERRLQGK